MGTKREIGRVCSFKELKPGNELTSTHEAVRGICEKIEGCSIKDASALINYCISHVVYLVLMMADNSGVNCVTENLFLLVIIYNCTNVEGVRWVVITRVQ